MHVLIAGVGYQDLRDLSLGPLLVARLKEMHLPTDVEIMDLSFAPIGTVQSLKTKPNYYDRMVFISSITRGREPGSIHYYRWNGVLPSPEEIQRRVGEALMGVISLDNLLIILQYFGVLPQDVTVIEVEPEDTNWGETLTPRLEARIEEIIETVCQIALTPIEVAP